MSLPEVLLWRDLRRRIVDGLRFRRQHAVENYVLDFYCPGAHLALEVDGAVHDNPQRVARDLERDARLRQLGITVLRFNASDILQDDRRQDVLATIVAAAGAPSTTFGGPPPPLRG